MENSKKFKTSDLKQKVNKQLRAKWRQKAHKEYAKSDPKYIWKSIDGEDMVLS